MPAETAELYFDGDFPALRNQLDTYLRQIGVEAASFSGVKAIFLAGGYGRGEGGVYLANEEAEPRLYNDLEFYAVITSPITEALHRWTHRGEDLFGIEIEWKTLSPHALETAAPSMFYYDLLSRHVLVTGDEHWVAALPEKLRSATAIPPVEASRLLVNRGMSLLRCRRWAAGEMDLPPDFCQRILAKLKLALADAVLCLHGQYHWSCRERARRLKQFSAKQTPPDWARLVEWHEQGVAFKMRPQFPEIPAEDWPPLARINHNEAPPCDLSGLVEEMIQVWLRTFLWVESHRLGVPLPAPANYLNHSRRLFPEEAPLKNLLRQLRDRRRARSLPWSGLDHPRAVVWKALVGLLDKNNLPQTIRLLALEKQTPAIQAEERLRSLWQNYP